MKWLLNNWFGRLYLITQISCLIITIISTVKFTRDSRSREEYAIWEKKKFYGVFEYGSKGQELPAKQAEALRESLESDKISFSKTRQEQAIHYLWPNLAVPLAFLIVLFIARGIPSLNQNKADQKS